MVHQSNLYGEACMDAVFSEDKKYRYVLRRTWKTGRGMVAFIGLNPSTATETSNDPTVSRCIDFAKRWGFSGMYMLNLFGLRSTNPTLLYEVRDPVGIDNDRYIFETLGDVRLIVACWGNHGDLHNRSEEFYDLLRWKGFDLKCFKVTRKGEPIHPLYIKKNQQLQKYIRGGE